MNEARRLGRSLSFLLEKSTEEKRKDNLKKYFLDPNCIESLQNEIIKLRKELEGIQVNTKTEYNSKIKDENPKRLPLNKCFVEWMENREHFPLNIKLSKQKLFTKFKEDNQDFNNSYFSRKAFNIWVRKYAEYKNLTYIDGSSGGARWFSLNQKNPKKVERPILKNLGSVAKGPSEYSLKGLNKQQIQEYTKRNTKKSINTKTYLIKNRRNGFYKIGRSKDPLKREQTLQSEEPDIVMVKTWDEDIERKLHIEYKDYRVRGEWFELSKAQVKYICTNYERSNLSK